MLLTCAGKMKESLGQWGECNTVGASSVHFSSKSFTLISHTASLSTGQTSKQISNKIVLERQKKKKSDADKFYSYMVILLSYNCS